MVYRWDLLKWIVGAYCCRSYLEVGVARRETFDRLDVPTKVGVDPDPASTATYLMTSDEFFLANEQMFDLVFVDGLHHADQARRDIEHAIEALSPDGTVVVHDCNPTTVEQQTVPQMSEVWTGDVWKAWVELRATRDDLEMFVLDLDWGCGVVRRGAQDTIDPAGPLTWDRFVEHRRPWLNLVPTDLGLSLLRPPTRSCA